MKKIIIILSLLLLPLFAFSTTIETSITKTLTTHLPPTTEYEWNKFLFGSTQIKWYRTAPGEDKLFQTLKVLNHRTTVDNDSVNIVKYQAESKLGKYDITKAVYRCNKAGYYAKITVKWSTNSGREMPIQEFLTITAKGAPLETAIFKYEQGETDTEFVAMRNTMILDPRQNKFFIINDDGNQTVLSITGVREIGKTDEGVTLTRFDGKVKSLNAYLMQMLPDDTTKPIMFCLVYMYGDVEAMKAWYSTLGIQEE